MNKQIPCNLVAAIIYLGALSDAFAQPHITTQPADHSVSLGANVTNLVSATSVAAPLSYQWRTNDVEIAGAANRALILTNIQLPDAGGYSAVVTGRLWMNGAGYGCRYNSPLAFLG